MIAMAQDQDTKPHKEAMATSRHKKAIKKQRGSFMIHYILTPPFQHFHFLKLLLILEFGSCAVLPPVSFFFMPRILAQNDLWRGPLGVGGFRWPLYEARPFAFRPPFLFFPSFLVHACDAAMTFWETR